MSKPSAKQNHDIRKTYLCQQYNIRLTLQPYALCRQPRGTRTTTQPTRGSAEGLHRLVPSDAVVPGSAVNLFVLMARGSRHSVDNSGGGPHASFIRRAPGRESEPRYGIRVAGRYDASPRTQIA
ncbi:uncharacterized protein LOC112452000 isoform X2 [Temnothorax curvispinosus]|uniref:Uncharacterized protein LOC112452000 isoform X2 n=1 Tax=Temnothorax curvispinosus TaxID=300111 RepID=A0A6J1PDZ5_9HYME|nr:uncharacterized protein LOC112452000 isoform X2 [Temnothorax curvispinosus]